MTIASAMFYWSKVAPFRYILPKGIRNRVFMHYISSLTADAIRSSGATEIYSTKPIECDPESPLKLWMVTSQKDLLMTFWCLKTLFLKSEESWDVWLADGGGLEGEPSALLKRHFPGIRILSPATLNEKTSVALRDYRWSYWLRHERGFALSIKLFDPLLHLAPRRFLLLDSDILFFEKPEELLGILKNDQRLGGHAFNLEKGKINSGLAVIDPSLIRLEKIEEHLARMEPPQRRGWAVEQDIYTLLAQDHFHGLSPQYAVQPVTDEQHQQCTACHYIGVVRHKFFSVGIPRLRARGFLDSLRADAGAPGQKTASK